MSPRTWVKSESSTEDSAPGAMIRFASRNAQISASVRRPRVSTSLSWFSMNRRASVTRAFRSALLWSRYASTVALARSRASRGFVEVAVTSRMLVFGTRATFSLLLIESSAAQ